MSKKSTLAVAIKDTNPNLAKAFEVLGEKMKGVKKIQESVFKTEGRLSGFNKSVQEETDISNLVKMAGVIVAREQQYEAGAKALGLQTYPVFKAEKYSVNAWIEDIKLRIDIIENKDKLEKLKSLEDSIKSMMSNQDKLAIILADLEKV